MTTVDFWAWYPVEIGTIFFVGVGASIVAALVVVSYRVWRTVTVWVDKRMRDSTRQVSFYFDYREIVCESRPLTTVYLTRPYHFRLFDNRYI